MLDANEIRQWLDFNVGSFRLSPVWVLVYWPILVGIAAAFALRKIKKNEVIRRYGILLVLPLLINIVLLFTGWFFHERMGQRIDHALVQHAVIAPVSWIFNTLLQIPVIRDQPLHIGVDFFSGYIAPSCAGVQGLFIFTILAVAWYFVLRPTTFRHRLIYLVLMCVGLCLGFVGNWLRLVALLYVGARVDRDLALAGFHDAAGGIIVLLNFALFAWVTHRALKGDDGKAWFAGNPVVPYVMPWMVWMALGMLSALVTVQWDWSYPLRAVIVFIILGVLAAPFPQTMIRAVREPPLQSVLAGLFIAAVWIIWGHYVLDHDFAGRMPTSLRFYHMWIVGRILGTVLLIPVIEELAFRGFLARALQKPMFQDLTPSDLRWPAMLISSVIFGVFHDALAVPGVGAGFIFALLYRKSGTLASPIIAHAVANLGVALYALTTGQWQHL